MRFTPTPKFLPNFSERAHFSRKKRPIIKIRTVALAVRRQNFRRIDFRIGGDRQQMNLLAFFSGKPDLYLAQRCGYQRADIRAGGISKRHDQDLAC